MALGLSFGKKKQTGTQTTNLSQTETGTQTGNTQQSQTTNQQQTQSMTGSTSGTTATTGTMTGSTTGVTTGQTQQTQQTRSFSDPILSQLEGLVGNLMGSSSVTSPANISGFDVDTFVQQGMQAANARTRAGLDEATNGLIDNIGGSGNSMFSLLQQRLMDDANAGLAGTQADLTARAEEIRRNNLLAGSSIQGSNQQFLGGLLSALRGGVTTATGATTSQEQQAQQTQQQTAGSETSAQTQQSQSNMQAVETMASVVEQLINSLTNRTGTEEVKSKTKQGGFGIGLSL